MISQNSLVAPGVVQKVSVVIATIGRPEMLRVAVRSIFDQQYEGPIEVLIVFDGIAIDRLEDIGVPENRTLRLMQNSRSPGLAGGRNTGILAADGQLIGFCDDDDEWHQEKLRLQLNLWQKKADAVAVSSGIRIQSDTSSTVRIPPGRNFHDDFLESRITAIHPSTMLFRRKDFMNQLGLVDESLPASYGEDYDLLLRATQLGDVISVQKALVTVHWDRPSFFAGKWLNIANGLTYILQKFPDLESSRTGTARIASQIAFSYAALGEKRTAVKWAYSALKRDPLQLRAYAALLVAARVVSPQFLLDMVNRLGRGL